MREYIKLWQEDGSCTFVDSKHAEDIGLAYEGWVERDIDAVLHLTNVAGEPYKMRASDVHSFLVTTSSGRAAAWEFQAEASREEQAHREAAGIWE